MRNMSNHKDSRPPPAVATLKNFQIPVLSTDNMAKSFEKCVVTGDNSKKNFQKCVLSADNSGK